MKVLIVSGFLGAGKTTFIKELSKKTGRLFCILENEFGAVNVDEAVLKQERADLKIYELTSGCICCSTKGEFASTCLTIANTVNPDYLIVEPTGVGSLSNIRKNLSQIEYERIEVLKPICIVDGISILNGTLKINEIFIDQIKQSDYIFVSKMENSSDDEKNLVYRQIHEINQKANIYVEHYSGLNSEFFFNLLNNLSNKFTESKEIKPIKMESVAFVDVHLPNLEFLIHLLDEVCFGLYGNIQRAKGIVSICNRFFQFDYVDSLYSIREYAESASKMVFIGENIFTNKLELILSATALTDDD